jgi:hypothetical protein
MVASAFLKSSIIVVRTGAGLAGLSAKLLAKYTVFTVQHTVKNNRYFDAFLLAAQFT